MQSILDIRKEHVTTIEFLNSSPLLNVNKIDFFQEINLTGNFLSKQFRYSFDNSIWHAIEAMSIA